MIAAAGALLLAFQADAGAPPLDRILERVSEEAEVFQKLAPKVIGREVLRHRSQKGAPRFRLRVGAAATQPAEVRYQTREIVSEYGYSFLKEAPEALREFRQVVEVDGRPVLAGEHARTTLAINMSSDDDRARRRLLQDFERHGTIGAATDFGQVILLFGRRMLANYDFTITGSAFVGADAVLVLDWQQKRGPDALQVYKGRELVRVLMQGQLWVRRADFLPLRVSLEATTEENPGKTVHAAIVDYWPSKHGLLLPAGVRYTETFEDRVMVENTYLYSDFRMFDVDVEIKFTPAEVPLPK